ncbi:hypothetical protein [Specibacter cremeus]|uniref:hypothetical protein n=1 Tax=Specibacter cremeus TaxID=1629051 RepID=UPI000F7B5ECA|nr:hypothetical protein [Specibacter cremeus]
MFLDRSKRPGDIPPPATPDEVAAGFAVPLLTLVDQDSVEEASAGKGWETGNGHPVMEVASLSYTLWRNPADLDDPVNLAELPDEVRATLDTEPPWPLPPWIVQWRARMRYPLLWEAVRTTHISDGSTWRTPELALVDHVNYIVMNIFRDERVRGEFPGDLFDPVTEACIEHGVPIVIDGVTVPGLRIDTDPHVLGLGADLGDKFLTAVLARRDLPFLRLEFATRRSPAPD